MKLNQNPGGALVLLMLGFLLNLPANAAGNASNTSTPKTPQATEINRYKLTLEQRKVAAVKLKKAYVKERKQDLADQAKNAGKGIDSVMAGTLDASKVKVTADNVNFYSLDSVKRYLK